MEEKTVSVYARGSGVVEADVEGVVILLDKNTWDFLEFNEVGSTIWEFLDKPKSSSELIELLVRKFDVSPARCWQEIQAFLDELVAAGLVTVTPLKDLGPG